MGRAIRGRRNEVALAAGKGVTPGQLALAWVLAQGEDVVPIPGTTQRSHLAQNLAALDIPLSQEDLARLDAACPRGATAGPRYGEIALTHVNG